MWVYRRIEAADDESGLPPIADELLRYGEPRKGDRSRAYRVRAQRACGAALASEGCEQLPTVKSLAAPMSAMMGFLQSGSCTKSSEVAQMAGSTDKVTFNPKPIRLGLAWGLVARGTTR